jgi:histone H3
VNKKAGANEAEVKKPHRFHPGTVALRNVIRCRKGTDKWSAKTCIRKLPFQRLVREMCQDLGKPEMRFQRKAMLNLHEAAEEELVDVIESAMTLAAVNDRPTLQAMDIRVALHSDRFRRGIYFGHGKLMPPVTFSNKKDGSYKGVMVMRPTYIAPGAEQKQ